MVIPRRIDPTFPKRVWLTEPGRSAIQTWADDHGMSFSAAIEALAKLGMGQTVDDALAPAIISVIRRELTSYHSRVIRLLLVTIIEAGTAARMAGAAVKYQRQAEPGVYEKIRDQARKAAKRGLARGTIANVLKELLRGYREGELSSPEKR